MKALSVFIFLSMSFFLLQSMDAFNNSKSVNHKQKEKVALKSLQRVSSLESVPCSVNYPLEALSYEMKSKLSRSQLVAISPDAVKREDSPPELRKERKKKTNKNCDSAETKQQFLEDQKSIELKLKKRLEGLSKVKDNNIKMSKSVSEADILLATLREIHAKKNEESSEEEN